MLTNTPRIPQSPGTILGLCFMSLALALLVLTSPPRAAAATKVVGNGTAASCSEAALRTALDGGGTITFSCGGALTIPVTTLIEISAATIIDGGGTITLDGGGATRIFYINKWERNNGLPFELRNLTLTRGRAGGSLDPTYGGCVYARRSTTRLINVTMRSCQASEAGGGLYIYGGEATTEGGLYTENSAMQGGAIYAALGGKLSVSGGTFQANSARGDGGAIYMGDSPLQVQGATFTGNVAEGTTGAPYAGLGGAIYTNKAGATMVVTTSSFVNNQASESGGAIFTDYYTSSSISNSTFHNNTSLPNVAGASGNGGAIGTAKSTLTLTASDLRNNKANEGGAIYNGKGSTMTISYAVIAANSGATGGGGIYNIGGHLLIGDSTVTDNVAGTATSDDKQGGGLVSYSDSTVEVMRSIFSGNRAIGTNAAGGGIFVHNTVLTVKLSTIVSNSAVRGGGIWHNNGTSQIAASTIANNTATSFGANIGINVSGPEISDTIVLGGSGIASCNKAVTDKGHNLQFPGNSCGAGIQVANPLLGTPTNNGGPTATMALAAGSPAIDAGNPATCLPHDQRSFSRQGTCDIGSFEFASDGQPNLSNHIFMPIIFR